LLLIISGEIHSIKMSYKIQNREDIESAIVKINNIISSLIDEDCINSYTGKLSSNSIQNLIYFRHGNDCSRDINAFIDIILRSCAIAESRSPGAGSISAIVFSFLMKDFKKGYSNKQRLKNIAQKRDFILDYGKSTSLALRRPSFRDIKSIFKKYELNNDIEKEIIKNIKKSDIFTNFEVDRSFRENSSVTNNGGHYLKIESSQLQTLGLKEWKRKEVNTIMIDGVVESVSQINHFLQKAADSKESFLIICKEASDEVLQTINLNFARGTVDLVILCTGYSVDYHHLFKDISYIFDCDYINIKMGDTISTHINKLTFNIESVEIYPSYLKIFSHGNNKNRISRYINDIHSIKNKIGNDNIEDYNKIISSIGKRVRFLSSSTVSVSIGKKDISQDGQIISKLNRFFRSFPDMGHTGIIDMKKCRDSLSREICKKTERTVFTQREIFQSLVTSFRIYESIIKAEKVFTIKD